MEQLRWNRIESLLQAALDLEAAARGPFLADACGSDAALRREVEEMLAAEGDRRLETPAIAAVVPHLAAVAESGQRISHYRIDGPIGAGGMGEVYLARDEALQRNVALKTLPPEFTEDAERARRFKQEAFTVSRLNHPNIITIFEVLHCDGTHWIATEHVEGVTLRELLKDRIPLTRALDIVIQVARALQAAHTAWIIHRDIKPENIMVRPDGVVKVLDFGIAKLRTESDPDATAGSQPTRPEATIAGQILGTRSYMSPEQAEGAPLDGRTDLYSLGLILREMTVHDRTPKAVARVIERMLRPNREDRYSSAAVLLDDLLAVRRRLEMTASRRVVAGSLLAAAVAVALMAMAAVLSITETWDERVLRDGHTAAARQAVFSPDGRRIVSCGEDGLLLVWDFETRERVATLDHHASLVAYAADGRMFASGGVDGTTVLWDARTLRRIRVLRHDRRVAALTFSPDGSVLMTGHAVGVVGWDTATGHRIGQWADGVSHGSFIFPAGNRFALSSAMSSLDVTSGKIEVASSGQANWIAMPSGRRRFATVDSRGDVRFYRLAVDDPTRFELLTQTRAHQDHGRAIAWSPDGRLAASGAEHIVLWDAERMEKLARFEYDAIVWSLDFSPDGRWMISAHGDGSVLIWDVADRQRVASLNAHSGAVRAVAFDPRGELVVTGGEDRSLIVWNLRTGRKMRVLNGHPTRITGVAFSHDGRWIASADHDAGTIIWNATSRRPRLHLAPPNANAYFLAWALDDRLLATTFALYDTAGRERMIFRRTPGTEEQGAMYSGAFLAGGRTLAGVSDGGWATVWDVRAARILAAHRLRDTQLVAAAVSPDGKWLVSGEDQGAVRLWSIDPLQPVAVLGRHSARVKAVAFSPDGRTVASAGDDKRIALWDVRRRRLVAHLGTHTSPVYAIAFSPDGRQLVSGEHDRSVRVYTRRRSLWGHELGR